jgi:carbon monoxide dehydrogenase subunit G
VSGALAKVGVYLIKGTVEKLTGQFFDCLKKNMQAFYRRW